MHGVYGCVEIKIMYTGRGNEKTKNDSVWKKYVKALLTHAKEISANGEVLNLEHAAYELQDACP